jgi:hypothetical protein
MKNKARNWTILTTEISEKGWRSTNLGFTSAAEGYHSLKIEVPSGAKPFVDSIEESRI